MIGDLPSDISIAIPIESMFFAGDHPDEILLSIGISTNVEDMGKAEIYLVTPAGNPNLEEWKHIHEVLLARVSC